MKSRQWLATGDGRFAWGHSGSLSVTTALVAASRTGALRGTHMG